MSEIEIRWATPEDWHVLGFVHSESYRSAYKDIMPDDFLENFTIEQRQNYYQKSLSEGAEKIALLFVDHKAAGCMILGPCRDENLDRSYGEIWGIYLLQSYWGKGYGKKLIHWGIDRLRDFGYGNVSLWVLKENTNARKFYEHLGFRFDGTEKLIVRGKELVQVRCFKKI